MWHDFVLDAQFLIVLIETDKQIAERIRKQGCPFCENGQLHRSDYPRKPRGIIGDAESGFDRRISFCCNSEGCRKRCTPPSVRFLGRKVYVGFIVIVAMIEKSARVEPRPEVPKRTLHRWETWWQQILVASDFWEEKRGNFAAPIDETQLPLSLLSLFAAPGHEALMRCLEFLCPVTTATCGRITFFEGRK